MNVESGIQIGDLWGILRRRARMILGTWLVAFLASYWIAMALPNEYESFATILVEPQSVSPELVKSGVGESDLNERLHIMTAQILSRPRLSRIIDDLELYREESKSRLREEIIDLMRSKLTVKPLLPELEREIMRRQEDIEINQFRIYFLDRNSTTAMKVAQRLANDFIEEHISERVKVSQKSLEFIEGELERISQMMREIEAKVAAVKAASPGRLPEDLLANQRRLEMSLSSLSRAQQEHDTARSDEEFWRAQRVAVEAMGRPTDAASPRSRLQLLELQIAEYQAKGFTDKHPDLIKAKQELEAIRESLVARQEEGVQDEASVAALQANFAYQTAEAERRRAELRMNAARDQIDRFRSEADEVELLIAETPAVAEQLDGLEREYRSQLASYQSYIVRQQQASVQADMERRQLGEQFRVLESAFEAPEPTSPNRPILIILGFVFAGALGVGVAILREATDTSVHTPQQLQTALNLPVLAAIPNIFLESDRIALRRRRIKTALAAMALSAFAITGGAANYVWVNGMPGFVSAILTGEKPAQAGTGSGAAAPGGGR